MVVGQEGVGKTSLIKLLTGQKLVLVQDVLVKVVARGSLNLIF